MAELKAASELLIARAEQAVSVLAGHSKSAYVSLWSSLIANTRNPASDEKRDWIRNASQTLTGFGSMVLIIVGLSGKDLFSRYLNRLEDMPHARDTIKLFAALTCAQSLENSS